MIPDFQAMMLPVLRLSDAGEIRLSDAVDRIADELSLTDQERQELVPSGRQTRIANRVSWVVTYLCKSGLLVRPRRGSFVIAPKGREVLSNPPERIDIAYLTENCGLDMSRKKDRDDRSAVDESMLGHETGTPEERVEAAFEDMNTALREELLERILEMGPTSFELLIVDLMRGLGYGAKRSGERFGRTGDGGIAGVISEDVLGLDRIYLQAKPYPTGNGIGVEKIKEFIGAMEERGATKGVFVTTSHFALAAIEHASRSSQNVILIDGDELTRLLEEYGVAVRNYRILELKMVDTEKYDDAEG